jgi:hypothetical protein
VTTALGAPISIVCPGTAKCKVEIESAPGDQFSETTPADGRYETSSEIEEINGVVHGTRLVQPWLYSAGGASVGYYMIVIRV